MFVILPTTKIKSLLAKGIEMYKEELSKSLKMPSYLAKSRAQSAAGSQRGGAKKLGGG
jgi:hypothetical protein